MTVQELINQALLDIGVLDAGETPSSTESDNALAMLNQLLTSWSAQAAPIYEITRELISLTGAQSYTLPTRPVKIKGAAIQQNVTVAIAAEIVDAATWAAYPDKNGQAPGAKVAYYEDGYPLAKLHLAPKPANAGTVEIYSAKPMRDGGLFEVRESFAVTGAASYTIGVGGQFATERPAKLLGVSVQAVTLLNKGLRIVDAAEFAAFNQRGDVTYYGDVLYYDGALSSPKVYIAPAPSTGTLELFTYRALTEFASLATTVTLPPGYPRALRTVLAIELASGYGVAVSATLQASADDARASIFGLNQAVLGHPGAPPIAEAPAAAAAAPPVVIAAEQ